MRGPTWRNNGLDVHMKNIIKHRLTLWSKQAIHTYGAVATYPKPIYIPFAPYYKSKILELAKHTAICLQAVTDYCSWNHKLR